MNIQNQANTLYSQLKTIDRITEDESILPKLQERLFQNYEENPVFFDAKTGKISIQDSLYELGKINEGIRKFLPWKKDEEHNNRLNQLGELIPKPYHLESSGIYMPNNLVTIGIETTGIAFFLGFLGGKFFINQESTASSEEIKYVRDLLTFTIPCIVSSFVTLFGSYINNGRFSELPVTEAKYLDGKINEFYT
jgi:hypothetical protein